MRPPDQVARELAHEWLAKADMDLSAASALHSAGDLTDVVAFHAQQVAEKALKEGGRRADCVHQRCPAESSL